MLQNQASVAPVMFCFRFAAVRIVAGWETGIRFPLFHQVQKPMHRSGGFDAYQSVYASLSMIDRK
jgi:hypothetical protein